MASTTRKMAGAKRYGNAESSLVGVKNSKIIELYSIGGTSIDFLNPIPRSHSVLHYGRSGQEIMTRSFTRHVDGKLIRSIFYCFILQSQTVIGEKEDLYLLR